MPNSRAGGGVNNSFEVRAGFCFFLWIFGDFLDFMGIFVLFLGFFFTDF